MLNDKMTLVFSDGGGLNDIYQIRMEIYLSEISEEYICLLKIFNIYANQDFIQLNLNVDRVFDLLVVLHYWLFQDKHTKSAFIELGPCSKYAAAVVEFTEEAMSLNTYSFNGELIKSVTIKMTSNQMFEFHDSLYVDMQNLGYDLNE